MPAAVYLQFEVLLKDLRESVDRLDVLDKLRQIKDLLSRNWDRIDMDVINEMGYASEFCAAVFRDNEIEHLEVIMRILSDLSFSNCFPFCDDEHTAAFLAKLIAIIQTHRNQVPQGMAQSILISAFWTITNMLKSKSSHLYNMYTINLYKSLGQCTFTSFFGNLFFRTTLFELVDTISCILKWEDFDNFLPLASKLVTKESLQFEHKSKEANAVCKVLSNLIRLDYRRVLMAFPWLLESLPQQLHQTYLNYHQLEPGSCTPFTILRYLSERDDAIADQLIDLGCLETLRCALGSTVEKLQLDAMFVISNFYMSAEYNITQRIIDSGCFALFNCESKILNRSQALSVEVLYVTTSLLWNSSAMQLSQLDSMGVLDFLLETLKNMNECPEKIALPKSSAIQRAYDICSGFYPSAVQKIILVRDCLSEWQEIDVKTATVELKYLSLGPHSVFDIICLSDVQIE